MLLAAADSAGTPHNSEGTDIYALTRIKTAGGRLVDHLGGSRLPREDVVGIDCDIWIPPTRPDVVREHNRYRVKARLIAQGANIAVTGAAEAALHARGVLTLPYFMTRVPGATTRDGVTPRAAAVALAQPRVRRAMELRR